MSYAQVNIPPRIGGNFLDAPTERGQVSVHFYKMFEQIQNNFNNAFDSNGNNILQSAKTQDRPLNPIKYLTIVDLTLNLPIWFDGTEWRDYMGTIV